MSLSLATLENKDAGVRQAVVEILGEIADPQAVKPLVEMLGDRRLHEAPVNSLVMIGSAAI